MNPEVTAFHHRPSGTITYVVAVPGGKHCALIDPVLDFEPGTGETSTASADAIIAFVRERDLTTDWILETDLHEDHLTAAPHLQVQTGGQIATGLGILQAASHYAKVFPNLADSVQIGRSFDHLFQDGERFHIGSMPADVLLTPGHSPAGVSYGVGDAVFVGESLLMPDCGTGRTDLPGSDPHKLYHSVQRILALPGPVRIYPGHDLRPKGSSAANETTVSAQWLDNVLLRGGADETSFVQRRRAADADLNPPERLLSAVQVNLRAGRLPGPEDNGIQYLRLPLNAL